MTAKTRPRPVTVEEQLPTPAVADAEERLCQLCDGAVSPLISLKNRLGILERLCNLQLELPTAEDSDFALAALVDDIQADRIAVTEAIEAVSAALEGKAATKNGGAR
jgi:hypothetical protein